jgi:hypothetical protein
MGELGEPRGIGISTSRRVLGSRVAVDRVLLPLYRADRAAFPGCESGFRLSAARAAVVNGTVKWCVGTALQDRPPTPVAHLTYRGRRGATSPSLVQIFHGW